MDFNSIEGVANSNNTNSSKTSSDQIFSQNTGRWISLAHSSMELANKKLMETKSVVRRNGERWKACAVCATFNVFDILLCFFSQNTHLDHRNETKFSQKSYFIITWSPMSESSTSTESSTNVVWQLRGIEMKMTPMSLSDYNHDMNILNSNANARVLDNYNYNFQDLQNKFSDVTLWVLWVIYYV